MPHATPILAYETPHRPNTWAKVSLIGGIVLLAGSIVPVCGLVVVPMAWIGIAVGLVSICLAIWGRRGRLLMSITGTALCVAAAFIPIGILGATPFLAELGLRVWASNQPPPATAPTTTSTTVPSTAPTDASTEESNR